MTVAQTANNLRINGLCEFLELDLTPYGAGFYRVINSIDNNFDTIVSFLGVDWVSLPFVSEGFEYDGTGGTPQPTLTIPDFDGTLLAATQQYDNLLGTTIRRYLTTKDNIASGSYFGPEVWLINQKEEADGFKIRFNLATKFTQRNKFIPGQIMTRDRFPALGLNKWR